MWAEKVSGRRVGIIALMKTRWLLVWLLIFSAALVFAAEPAQKPKTILIRAGALWDGSGALKTNQLIVVQGNKIVKVMFEGAGEAVPQPDETIDLSSAVVLPGLIDSHTHLFLQGEDPAEGGYDAQILMQTISYRTIRATVSARRALEQGFTTIRDVETEGAGYGDIAIKQAIEAGYIPGPRVIPCGRAISTTGGYPLEAAGGYRPEIVDDLPKGVQIIDGPVEARKAAREQLDAGVEWIKVYMTHRSWVGRQGELISQPTLTVAELKEIVDEAHGQGKKVACHAYNGVGLHRALDGGCDSIEHGLELDDAAIAQMVKQGTWYVPTLSVYYYYWEPEGTPAGKRDRKRAEVHGPTFQKAVKAGVRIAFGTDAGGFPWSDPIAQEFGRMVEFGMSPQDVIRAATVRGAELLGMEGAIGVIAPGAFADIIAVAGDPAKDVNVLRDVKFVMKDGQVFKGL